MIYFSLHETQLGFYVLIDRRQSGWGSVKTILIAYTIMLHYDIFQPPRDSARFLCSNRQTTEWLGLSKDNPHSLHCNVTLIYFSLHETQLGFYVLIDRRQSGWGTVKTILIAYTVMLHYDIFQPTRDPARFLCSNRQETEWLGLSKDNPHSLHYYVTL